VITCSRCLMDTTDPAIVFDKDGVCNHCHTYDQKIERFTLSGNEGRLYAQALVRVIKEQMGKGKYNCIIGISGGVDSSYLAYLVKEQYHLNPLAIHFDNGWDTDIAVSNIKRVLDNLGIDLYTYVIDWEEFKDLQLAFLKASTPDSEIPTDHAIVGIMNKLALKFQIPFIISGANARTESHVPSAWSQGHWDSRYIRSVHKHHGSLPLESYPFMSFKNLLSVKWVRLLNYLDYDKEEAKRFLIQNLGWEDYGWKHNESIYTRFYQGYILPVKFGYDKRKSHLSSLICAGILDRTEALKQLGNSEYPSLRDDLKYVTKKLGISIIEFSDIMRKEKKEYSDYSNNAWILRSRWFQNIYQKRSTIQIL